MASTHDMARNSFIANVNKLAKNLEAVNNVNNLYTPEQVDYLVELAKMNINALMKDLEKGSLHGHRKLDISLLENFLNYRSDMSDEERIELWLDPTQRVYYSGITVWFTDRTQLHKEFMEIGIPISINNHEQLFIQLHEWPEFKTKFGMTMFNLMSDDDLPNHELLRFWDGEGTGSFIERIQLHVAPDGQNQVYDSSFAGAKDYSPLYTWIYTTSTLEVIAQSLNQLLVLSGRVDEVVALVNYLTELTSIYAVLDKLASNNFQDETIHKNLFKLDAIYRNLTDLLLLGDVTPVLEKINKEKANIIIEEIPAGFDLSFTMPSDDNNSSLNYTVGSILTSGEFSFRVTDVTDEGRILEGVLSPLESDDDISGSYIFTGTDNSTELRLTIEATPKDTLVQIKRDLIDVYNELKSKSNEITNLSNTLAKLDDYLNDLEKVISTIDLTGNNDLIQNFVLKLSNVAQLINSDLTFAVNRKLSGTRIDGNSHPLIQSGRMTTGSGSGQLVRETVEIGSTSEHLNLRTNNDPVYENKITVNTPGGMKQLMYTDEVSDVVAVNFLLGSCIPWAGINIPDQTKLAVGNEYLIVDYPGAGAALGDTYGGDGIRTFGTPDLRNEPPDNIRWVIVLGKDSGSSTRLYCGREGIYCGKDGLYIGMKVTD